MLDPIAITHTVDAALLIEQIRTAFPELVNQEIARSLPGGGSRFLYCPREDGTAVDLYPPDDFTRISELVALIAAHNPQDAFIGAKPPFSAGYQQAEASRIKYMEKK